ncbi:YkvA family protein [Cyanobium sp. WAJ14-Wanaka]|uniref:YkvA family protein n=1 Tax=Cyanobium sp. WAJ14-Wanaka TaxID=2823725 RepID=UPI0020CD1B70|nr:DUF1232 domain-containing protein [Cyanobium sp. WAJ14-Wanaka]MCP9774996.1 DUF1232 domain-containing protein [Cyanobium sp. WAJ14-Wanaka]
MTSEAKSGAGPWADAPLEAEVLESKVVDEMLMIRVLRRAGRLVARPALECLELLLDPQTPATVKATVLAALTYLLMPMDGIPDFIPALGFSDDLVAMTALLGLCARHLTPSAAKADVLNKFPQPK